MHNRIKALRQALGMTQSEFGKAIGLSRDGIASYERCKANPTGTAIKMICSQFGVSEQWLVSGSGDMFSPKTSYDEIAAYWAKLSDRPADDFQVQLMSVLARLPDDKWAVIESIATDLANTMMHRKK